MAELKEVLAKRKVILVSTQVVEAGVNLISMRSSEIWHQSIDYPMQDAATGKAKKRQIKVTCMVDSSGKSYASRIYRNVIINITAEL